MSCEICDGNVVAVDSDYDNGWVDVTGDDDDDDDGCQWYAVVIWWLTMNEDDDNDGIVNGNAL